MSSSSPAIRTILLCDLVASTRLVERVCDAAAAELLARHDALRNVPKEDFGIRAS